jgi:hypothetical protein
MRAILVVDGFLAARDIAEEIVGAGNMDSESGQRLPLAALGWELIEHSGEHYGQLVAYFRVAGLVPPESRPKK